MRLGDFVYYITRYTGVKWLVKKILKYFGFEDCGCDRRREEWNEIKINRLDKWKN